MNASDLLLTIPALQPGYREVGLSTDAKPTLLSDGTGLPVPVGTEFREDDTGRSFYYDGSVWQPCTFPQKLDQLIETNIAIRDLLQQLVDRE